MSDAKPLHASGAPRWVELAANDLGGALRFYQPLLGWSGEPDPALGGYALLGPRGRAVAAIGPVPPNQPPAPATWTVYFAVDDVDAAARRITEHSGTPLYGPGDAPGGGRLAVAMDPAGAQFGIRQTDSLPGFKAEHEPGAPARFELETFQGEQSARFYAAVLGIQVPPVEQDSDSGWRFAVDGAQVAGIRQDRGTEDRAARPPKWLVYFQVPDADAFARDAVAAGAWVERPPQDFPHGRVAQLVDPQGARFAVITVL